MPRGANFQLVSVCKCECYPGLLGWKENGSLRKILFFCETLDPSRAVFL